MRMYDAMIAAGKFGFDQTDLHTPVVTLLCAGEFKGAEQREVVKMATGQLLKWLRANGEVVTVADTERTVPPPVAAAIILGKFEGGQ